MSVIRYSALAFVPLTLLACQPQFIKTVNQDVIDNEKQVVKNEKRQRVDNAPYGHNWYVIGKALYPSDHPYNWQVIGSLEDLDAASLKDTQDFYARWYVPNNVTVTITGDFDVAEAKTWVKKYFGEIPRGEDIEPYGPRPGELSKTVKLIHEDNFATVPRLTHVWPTVEQYHPDSYALAILDTYLTRGKTAPCFVPMGEPALGVEGSAKADVVEEVIVEGEGAAVEFDPAARIIENPTPSSFDRTIEPPFGESYDLPSPKIWQATYVNGLNVLGLASDEIPVINFTLRLDAGRLRNSADAPAIAGMTADMLSKGTKHKTTAELEDAIGALGSSISITRTPSRGES